MSRCRDQSTPPTRAFLSPPPAIPSLFSALHTHTSCLRLLALLLVLAQLLLPPTPARAYDLLPTPSVPPIAIQSPRNPVTNLTRFAYVALHYEGTPRDDEYLLGLRTTLFSLRRSGTDQDVLVLLSANARPSTRAALLADGVLVHDVDNIQNPFKTETSDKRRRTYKSRFEFTFNKLYLWNLTQYERVIYMDSDNIVLSNPDELFLCGHFCVVYMNPLLFHTGLMVIKPDTDKFHELVETLFSSDSYSHDGADQGFLCAVFDMEDAPLYDVRSVVAGVPMDEPKVRLAIGYNLNQFWYYNYFTWDFYRHNNYYWNRYAVPGLTIAYPSNWWMKPWYWYMEAYLYHHWTWQYVRWQLEGYAQWQSTVVSRLLLAAAIQLTTWLLMPLLCNLRTLSPLTRLTRALVALSPAHVGYAVGGLTFVAVTRGVLRCVPMLMPTVLAYPVYVVLHVSFMWLVYYTYCLLLRGDDSHGIGHGRVGGGANGGGAVASAVAAFEESVRWRWFMVFVAMHLFTFHLFHPYFFHFIVKIAAFIWTLMLWVGVDAHMFRRAGERMLHEKQP